MLTAFGLVDDDGNAIIDPDKSRKTIEQGAATTVWCATSPQLDGLGGLYAQDCDIAPLVDAIGVREHRLRLAAARCHALRRRPRDCRQSVGAERTADRLDHLTPAVFG